MHLTAAASALALVFKVGYKGGFDVPAKVRGKYHVMSLQHYGEKVPSFFRQLGCFLVLGKFVQ